MIKVDDDLTHEQKVLIGIFKGALALSNSGKSMMVNDLIAQRLRAYPFASEVETAFVNGEITIIEADDKIKSIVGYTPEELKGQPLSKIMFAPLEGEKLKRTIDSLDCHGVAVKTNMNKHKDGSLVETFGWIFKVGENDYREVVMRASHVVGYGTK